MSRAWRGLLALGLLFLARGAGAADAPFLWEVQGAQARHFMIGSMHVLPASAYPLPAALEQAYAQTRALVLETDPAALQTPAAQQRMAQAGRAPQSLRAQVAPALYARVDASLNRVGLPGGWCDAFTPWFCALSLGMAQLQRAGMSAEHGLDAHFHRRALRDARPCTWLETPEAQLALFAGMSAAQAEEFLGATLDDLDQPALSPEALLHLWRDNRVAQLDALVRQARRAQPQTHERLLAARNRAWMAQLAPLLEGATPQLVIVGAAHLVGPDALPALLAARGFRVAPASEPAH